MTNNVPTTTSKRDAVRVLVVGKHHRFTRRVLRHELQGLGREPIALQLLPGEPHAFDPIALFIVVLDGHDRTARVQLDTRPDRELRRYGLPCAAHGRGTFSDKGNPHLLALHALLQAVSQHGPRTPQRANHPPSWSKSTFMPPVKALS
jgi:hypothetical protein